MGTLRMPETPTFGLTMALACLQETPQYMGLRGTLRQVSEIRSAVLSEDSSYGHVYLTINLCGVSEPVSAVCLLTRVGGIWQDGYCTLRVRNQAAESREFYVQRANDGLSVTPVAVGTGNVYTARALYALRKACEQVLPVLPGLASWVDFNPTTMAYFPSKGVHVHREGGYFQHRALESYFVRGDQAGVAIHVFAPTASVRLRVRFECLEDRVDDQYGFVNDFMVDFDQAMVATILPYVQLDEYSLQAATTLLEELIPS